METDREVERIDNGGSAWSSDDDVVELTVKRPLEKVVPVRLSHEHWQELRREARLLGIGPSTLLRMWLVEKLRERSAAQLA